MRRIARNYQVTSGRHHRVARKSETDRIRQFPAIQMHGVRAAIIKLDVLVVDVATDWIIHQLIEDKVTETDSGVRGPRRFCAQPVELARAVWPASTRHPILLTIKMDG